MADAGHELTERELSKLERKIHSVYEEAAAEVSKAAAEYFKKFEARDEQKKQDLENGLISKEEYAEWRRRQITTGKRYEALAAKLAERMTNANEVAVQYVNDKLPSVYSLNRNYAAFEIESALPDVKMYGIEQAHPQIDFTLFSESTVRRMVMDDPKSMPYYPEDKAIRRGIDLAWGQKKINQTVTSGILRGIPLRQIAKEIGGTLGKMDEAAAMRTARTALTSAQNGGRQAEYEAAADKFGIKAKKEWISSNDRRVRDSHAHLHGVRVPVDKPFPNGLMYPADPNGAAEEVYNCRCTMGEVFAEMEKFDYDVPRNTVGTYLAWKAEKEAKLGQNSNFTSDIKSYIIHNVDAGGHRNEAPLTEQQIKECMDYAESLGMPRDRMRYAESYNLSYGSVFDILYIGTDAYPNLEGKEANELLSYRAAIAHEIIGHREAAKAGHDLKLVNEVFDEVQASIRAARFTPDLSQQERTMLLRDAVARLHHNGYKVKDIRNELYIDKR